MCFLSPRYKGNFLQSRFQLRASRLRKPHWVLRKDGRSPPAEGPAPRRTCGQASSETAGKALLGGESKPGTRLLGCETSRAAILAVQSLKSSRETDACGMMTKVSPLWDSRDPKLGERVLGENTENPILRRQQTSSSTGHGCPALSKYRFPPGPGKPESELWVPLLFPIMKEEVHWILSTGPL